MESTTPQVAQQTTTPKAGSENPLTRREQQVAELVARGMTNRDIAAALVIDARTAEHHVGHILAKLGFRGRAQIAAWVKAQQRGTRR